MVVEILLGLAFSFAFVVLASYVGTMMALRGYFGREYYDSDREEFYDSSGEGPTEQ